MSRVSDIGPESLPDDLRTLYQRYATDHGRFGNQVAILAHVRPALRHLTAMLMELRGEGTVSRRHIELAVVAVSKLNACDYCVAHHAPALVVEGLSPAAVEHVLDYRDHPDLDAIDRLVVEYAIAVTESPRRISDRLFERLRRHFDEAQIVELTLRIALCGFFNRFNDAMQIEQEQDLHTGA